MTGTKRMPHSNSLANLKPRKAGCTPHGFVPAGKCKECNARQARERRRRNGAKPRPVGCSKHGSIPASECLGCKWDKAQKTYDKRRSAGVPVKPVGCSPHNFFPARECRKCMAEDARNYRKGQREIREQEHARLASYAQWEAEQLGRPDAEQKLLERAVRDNAHGREAQEALDKLNAALLSTVSPCKGDTSYTDGTFTRSEAALKCVDCPVLELCKDYGKAAKAEYKRRGYRLTGIYGGIRAEDLR